MSPHETADRDPDHWVRRRAGDPEEAAIEISAAAAAMIAQRPDAVHAASGEIIWQAPDADAYSGLAFWTLTPVWEPTGGGCGS